MKLTKSTLKRLIKEELGAQLGVEHAGGMGPIDPAFVDELRDLYNQWDPGSIPPNTDPQKVATIYKKQIGTLLSRLTRYRNSIPGD